MKYGPLILLIVIVAGIVAMVFRSRRKVGSALTGRYHTGGFVSDSSHRPDGIPALLTRGDYWAEHGFKRNPVMPEQRLGRSLTADEIAEVTSMPPPPNIGGEGHVPYRGPHYNIPHGRFVPYDMLHDPIPGTAVHKIGNVACVGPLADDDQ